MTANEMQENEQIARWFRHCEMEERFHNNFPVERHSQTAHPCAYHPDAVVLAQHRIQAKGTDCVHRELIL